MGEVVIVRQYGVRCVHQKKGAVTRIYVVLEI